MVWIVEGGGVGSAYRFHRYGCTKSPYLYLSAKILTANAKASGSAHMPDASI